MDEVGEQLLWKYDVVRCYRSNNQMRRSRELVSDSVNRSLSRQKPKPCWRGSTQGNHRWGLGECLEITTEEPYGAEGGT